MEGNKAIAYTQLKGCRLTPSQSQYPFTAGWNEMTQIKCLVQGHNVQHQVIRTWNSTCDPSIASPTH